jgi:hypothetical protein
MCVINNLRMFKNLSVWKELVRDICDVCDEIWRRLNSENAS